MGAKSKTASNLHLMNASHFPKHQHMRIRTPLASAVTAFCIYAPFQRLPAQSGAPGTDVSPTERTSVLEGAIAQLNASYIYPETAKKMETGIRARMSAGEYESITGAKPLAEKLTADLREVSHDKHLGVKFFPEGARERPAGEPSPEEIKAQRPMMEKLNFGFEKVERMQGNVGYLEIRGFVPPAAGGETASAAMTFLAHTDALIVDLRKNGGGEPAMIAYLLTYLFDSPTHLNDIYERSGDKTQQWWTLPYVPGLRFGGKKPVYVLTSRHTFSGAEEFAYNLKVLKRATVIGEATGGGAHPSRPVKLSEHFAIELPYARAINPVTNTNWEGTGVAPDVPKPAEEALEAAFVMALEQILKAADNPRQKDQLRKLIEGKSRGKD
jgi:hypothetical protein